MEVQAEKIEKLEELVNQYIDKDKTVVDTKITRLTAPGENYGSTIMKVDLVLKDKDEKEEPLSIVAKLLPENEFFQELFNVRVTFDMEVTFYEVIVPTLQNFQRQQGVQDVIDFFPKFYGARRNLDGGEKIDENAILLMENLKISGFQNVDRLTGCDFDTAKFILKDLAQLHAVPIALKILRPRIFETYIKTCTRGTSNFDSERKFAVLEEILEENYNCKPLIEKLKKSGELHQINNVREPFFTLVHMDLWTNNFMVKLDKGKVVDNKFLDFQNYACESSARDLLSYLFISVHIEVLQEHLDDLLAVYYEEFIQCLEDLRCPTKAFSFEKYLDEIKFYGSFEFFHILYLMVFVSFAEPPTPEEMGYSANSLPKVTKNQKERTWWVAQEFEKRKWLEM